MQRIKKEIKNWSNDEFIFYEGYFTALKEAEDITNSKAKEILNFIKNHKFIRHSIKEL